MSSQIYLRVAAQSGLKPNQVQLIAQTYGLESASEADLLANVLSVKQQMQAAGVASLNDFLASAPQPVGEEFESTDDLMMVLQGAIEPYANRVISQGGQIIKQRDQFCEDVAEQVLDELEATEGVFLLKLGQSAKRRQLPNSSAPALGQLGAGIFKTPTWSSNLNSARKLLKPAEQTIDV